MQSSKLRAEAHDVLDGRNVDVSSSGHLGVADTVDFRTGYTPTEAAMLRKKMIVELIKLPTHAPAWAGLGMMKTKIKMRINSVDSHLGIQTD